MKIVGWRVTCYTDEFRRLGWVKKGNPTEFGNSKVRDKRAREEYVAELLARGEVFTLEAITG